MAERYILVDRGDLLELRPEVERNHILRHVEGSASEGIHADVSGGHDRIGCRCLGQYPPPPNAQSSPQGRTRWHRLHRRFRRLLRECRQCRSFSPRLMCWPSIWPCVALAKNTASIESSDIPASRAASSVAWRARSLISSCREWPKGVIPTPATKTGRTDQSFQILCYFAALILKDATSASRRWRNTNRCTLPLGVRGSASMKCTERG